MKTYDTTVYLAKHASIHYTVGKERKQMPITRSAKKKVRQDKKRYLSNNVTKGVFRVALKEFKIDPSPKHLISVYSALDVAAKKHVIHKNKAARLKSRLTKLVRSKTTGTVKHEKNKKSVKKQETAKKTV